MNDADSEVIERLLEREGVADFSQRLKRSSSDSSERVIRRSGCHNS
jgi:hypothetical protein